VILLKVITAAGQSLEYELHPPDLDDQGATICGAFEIRRIEICGKIVPLPIREVIGSRP